MAIFHAEFFSKCLMRLVDVDICLPIEDLVEPQPQEGPFPTLYLLHGYTGRSADWLHGSCIAELSRQYGIAVVMPSGENSFYEDDTEAGFLYSTFVGQELVELTRAAFPLCRDREHTWMAGLSMGGFGTLLNACKFSETFSAAACFSSAFIIQDIAGMKPGAVIPSGVGNYGYYRRVFGDLDAWQAVRETRYIGPKRPNRRAHCPGCTLPVERRIRFSPITLLCARNWKDLVRM